MAEKSHRLSVPKRRKIMKLGRKKSSLLALFSIVLASTFGGCGGSSGAGAALSPSDASADSATGDPLGDSGSDDSDSTTSSVDAGMILRRT